MSSNNSTHDADNYETSFECRVCKLTNGNKLIKCDLCKTSFHISCAEFPELVYDNLCHFFDCFKHESGLQGINWFCNVCHDKVKHFKNTPDMNDILSRSGKEQLMENNEIANAENQRLENVPTFVEHQNSDDFIGSESSKFVDPDNPDVKIEHVDHESRRDDCDHSKVTSRTESFEIKNVVSFPTIQHLDYGNKYEAVHNDNSPPSEDNEGRSIVSVAVTNVDDDFSEYSQRSLQQNCQSSYGHQNHPSLPSNTLPNLPIDEGVNNEIESNSKSCHQLQISPLHLAHQISSDSIPTEIVRQIPHFDKDVTKTTMIMHAKEKRFECTFCRKTFKKKGTLTQHIRIHTGDKRYHCSFCTRKFTQRSGLIIHQRIHTGEKPYTCSVCHMRFSDACNRKKHMLRHSVKHSISVLNFTLPIATSCEQDHTKSSAQTSS